LWLVVPLMLEAVLVELVQILLNVPKAAVVQVEELFCNPAVLILTEALEHLMQREVQVLAAVVLVETEESELTDYKVVQQQ